MIPSSGSLLGYLDEHKKLCLTVFAQTPPPCCLVFHRVPCWGLLLFLIFINDLPDNINSTVRLFADNCVLYRNIRGSEDQQLPQDDLEKLVHWEEAWLMKFNVAKCHSMRVTKKSKRKVQGVPQSQTAALPRPQEEEETDKSKQAQTEQTYEKH